MGASVNLQLTASGGTAPYTSSATGLPAGLSLGSSNGLITGAPTGVAIPDLSTVTSSATSAAEVHIKHTWRGDLVIDLVAPDGSAYRLKNSSSGDSADQTFTVNLSGEARNGTWQLRVQDVARSDVGTIDTWTLTL